MNIDAHALSRAMVIWTGFGLFPYPQRSDDRVLNAFGKDAVDLLPQIRRLEEDFYKSEARLTAPTLQEMGDVAIEDFRVMHPETSSDIVEALAWCYVFDYK